jgi:hypothetical protein
MHALRCRPGWRRRRRSARCHPRRSRLRRHGHHRRRPPISSASLVPVMTPRMLMPICRSDTASDSWAPLVVEDVEVAESADGQHGRVNLVGQRLELVWPVGSLWRQATLGPARAGAHWIAGSRAATTHHPPEHGVLTPISAVREQDGTIRVRAGSLSSSRVVVDPCGAAECCRGCDRTR